MPRPGFFFLVCPDSRLLQARLEALVSAQGGSSPLGTARPLGDEEPSPRFWEQLTLQGLFGTPRLLVVRQAHLWPAAVWKKISAALARPSEQCWPFFCLEVPWEKGQPKIPAHIAKLRCLGFADQQGWIWRSEGLSERSLKKYVRDRAQALGIPFEADAFEQFCTSVPPDAQAVENELEKLLLLRPAADGQAMPWSVTTDMLATSSWAPECNIFACIRHMEAGNLAAVWKELARGRKDVEGLLFPCSPCWPASSASSGRPARARRSASIPPRPVPSSSWPAVWAPPPWPAAWAWSWTPNWPSRAAAARLNKAWTSWPPILWPSSPLPGARFFWGTR